MISILNQDKSKEDKSILDVHISSSACDMHVKEDKSILDVHVSSSACDMHVKEDKCILKEDKMLVWELCLFRRFVSHAPCCP